MKRTLVFQNPDDGQCLNACLATLIGVPLDEAPEIHLHEQDDPTPYLRRVRWWLASRGYSIMGFKGRPGICAGATYIAMGDSPRPTETSHAVVKRGTKVIHDPRPSGAGKVGHRYSWVIVKNLWEDL